ncbi:PilZ domain-containing protein [Sphingomonas sp. TREG-RG-20F-R18-01]|uniref:PilZ domain-containing protein n=1 Tax=Sphingomonas sp. TREG-RG-20F-R18-01 TaxID=2914982 RepID=UPI001F58810F|nr:PilZ domain-containing protein [Sphingomonas sp. TREG-RG-20F-R18-01]
MDQATLGPVPVADEEPERRIGDRVAITVGITLRERNWKAQPAGLLEVSRTGCRVDNLTITPGSTVWVKLPGLEPIEAKVSWSRAWQCGIRFDQPLHPAVFDHLVARTAGAAVAR